VIWSSTNPAVMTVTGGVVKAVGKGNASVIAITEDGNFAAMCSVTVTGFTADLNGDGDTTEADALYLLRYTILPSRYPLAVDNADYDGSGTVDAKDAAYLLTHIQ